MFKIVGTKIRKLREEMGLTQQELAKSVGLSSKFISQLELGRRAPSLESLSRISKFLKKDFSYFIVEKEVSFSLLLRGEGLDRKAKRMLKKFQSRCSDYLELEDLTGRYSNLAPLYANVTAERMADQERRRLGLGNEPVRNIFSLLELNGLRVLRLPVPEDSKISGVYIFVELKQAAFALVNSNQTLGRQVSTAAHEYGHYLRDRYDGPVVDNPDIFIDEYLSLYHPRERFAQKFAAYFLMPRDKVEEIIEKDIRKSRLGFEDVLYLKRYFGVDTLAILQTLREMEYISATRFKEYQKLDVSQYEEPLFGNLKGERQIKTGRGRAIFSDRFISLTLDAYRKKRINTEKLSKLLNQDEDNLVSIIGKSKA